MSNSQEPKKRHLSVFLLKEGVDWRSAVQGKEDLKAYPLSEASGLHGELYVKPMRPHPPWWLEFMQPAVEPMITDQNVGTMSAAMFLEVDDRAVVFTFGFGRHIVDHHKIEPDFGLKAALNAIDPDRLRSLDVRTYEAVALLTRREVSQSSSTAAFLVDPLRDVLTKVVGSPQSSSLGTRLTGRESLSLTIPVNVIDLAEVARKLISLFGSDTYKERFGWVDQVQPVREPDDLERLDESLMRALKEATAHDVLYLASPEILEWENVEFFRYTSQRAKDDTEFQELDIRDYLLTTEVRRKPPSIESLKSDRVQMKRAGIGEPMTLASIYRCIVFETTLDDQRYVLLAGDWWRIDKDFVDEVESQLDQIPVSDLMFPAPHHGEHEKDYLTRSVEQLEGSVLLDRQTVWYGGGRSQIEVCDILTEDGAFIHAKARGRSSTLSHLWSQGTVSAEAFASDETFRQKARDLLPNDRGDLLSIERPVRDAHGVVYLIIGADQEAPWRSLPFFSKVALMQASRQLGIVGFPLTLAGTPGEDS